MPCTLPCCGTFCCFVSAICAIMQFVFYALLNDNNERLDIGESESDRKDYSKTALYTAIIYVGLVVVSLICMASGRKQRKYSFGEEIATDDQESAHLLNDSDNRNTYESTQPVRSIIDDNSIQ
eukprot:425860_1